MKNLLWIGGGVAAVLAAMYFANKDKGTNPTPVDEGRDVLDPLPDPVLQDDGIRTASDPLPVEPKIGVQNVVPAFLLPPAPREEPRYAFDIPQVYPTPVPAPILIPSPAVHITRPVLNTDSNANPFVTGRSLVEAHEARKARIMPVEGLGMGYIFN